MMAPNEYELTPDERGMLDGITAQVLALQAEMQAVLRAIVRLRRLEGNWTLTPDGKLTRPE